MPIIKESLIAKCFHCKSKIIVKFVPVRKEYSQKNNWGYWTENEEQKKTYVCDDCLIILWKYKWEVRKLITNEKKRKLLGKYIKDGTIIKQEKTPLFLDTSGINDNSCNKCKQRERERERERERAKSRKIIKNKNTTEK